MIVRELINLIGFEVDEAQAREVEGRVQTLFKSVDRVGKELSLKVTAPILAAAGFAVKEFTDYAVTLAIVNRQILNTGGSARRTAEDLKRMSESISDKSLYEDDQILKRVAGTLLTFDKIAGDTFDAAAQAATDLAARWDLDLRQAGLMVGRALNNPAESLDMLTRRYVQMTKAEKDHIKALVVAGRITEAQRLIIDKINRSVGGMAAEIRDASSGFTVFINKLKNVAQGFGEIIQPYFKRFYAILVRLLDRIDKLSPTAKKTIVIFAGIAAAIGPLLVLFASLGGVITLISGSIKAIGALVAALSGEALLIIAAVAAALLALYFLVEDFMVYMKGGESIFGRFLKPWSELLPQIKERIEPLIGVMKKMFTDWVQYIRGILQIIVGLVSGDTDMIVAGLKNVIVGLVKFLFHELMLIGGMLYNLIPVVFDVLKKIFFMAIDWVDKMIKGIADKIMSIPVVGTLLKGFKNMFSGYGGGTAGSPFSGIDLSGMSSGMNYAWQSPPSSTNKNINVQSTIAMTVPAGTQQQQIAAVKLAAEQATTYAWNNHLRTALLQVQP